ncbi:uncharacterized protein BO87DRAFT_68266 [Aspergillus neoniger CBS 115656]|uniref:Uncharacterized protein n=1 Tax=Aspergillus neoniger (strain CBS 115656) TaxID=1448310 RepID=A0A318YGE7_ASPNB|nr:hypothetical protein BO87DRAFT_68266 [Aspergillus neoniger CBS 115656]PYH33416.1 hypothetical protein BO87DRAFT_68266 [Aspergillus neoniger CBS 115656]
MMSVFLFPVELAAFRWAGVCIYPSSGCFHLLCPFLSIFFPILDFSSIYSFVSSDIYIPRICDKPIWQLNLHPLHYQSSPCLGHSALQQYILIIVIYSYSKSAETYLFNFLHYCHHLAVLLLLLGILCVCVCVCVCVCSFYYTERFRSYLDRLPLTILLYVSVFD